MEPPARPPRAPLAPVVLTLTFAIAVAVVILWESEVPSEEENWLPKNWPKAKEGYEYVYYRVNLRVVDVKAEFVENVLVRIPYPHFLEEKPPFYSSLQPPYENIEIGISYDLDRKRKLALKRWYPTPGETDVLRIDIVLLNVHRGDEINVEAWIHLLKDNVKELTLRREDNTIRVDFIDITPSPDWKPGMPGVTFLVSGDLWLVDNKGLLEHWAFKAHQSNAIKPIVVFSPLQARWLDNVRTK